MNPDQDLLSPCELAGRWGVSTKTIYRGVKAGRIPHLRIGREIRIDPVEAAMAYLVSTRVHSCPHGEVDSADQGTYHGGDD